VHKIAVKAAAAAIIFFKAYDTSVGERRVSEMEKGKSTR
jgi:hypothetical protein